MWYTSIDYERGIFDHVRHEYLRCTSRVVCGLNTLGFYCVTITYSSLEYSRIFWLLRSVGFASYSEKL